MNQGLLLLALLAHPDCSCGEAEARRVVAAAGITAARHGVPQDLLIAVVLSESRCTSRVARPPAGGCDVGYAQVHLEVCLPSRVRELLEPGPNLARAARVLSWSRRACSGRLRRHRRCKATVWALYNWHSSTWWPQVRGRLEVLHRTYRRLHAARKHYVW